MIFISCSLGYCLVTFFAENLATFLEIFFSNQDINTIFFLAVSYFLRFASFFNDSLDFGFCSYRLSLLIRNCASSSKVSLTATYLFCGSALFLCSMDAAKLVDQLGLCMYRNSCLKYCISVK